MAEKSYRKETKKPKVKKGKKKPAWSMPYPDVNGTNNT